ncbi:hypothetical protein F4821DRAFT_203143 [Hypoxylon rubiginosum]|uniref:Uncharacterized protein n=1 Tax=Hypoxylon rubiginosum TaxID=110542 RepID=A0ACC0CRC1_9PEZI|nr:hypothetical protein F4821DRAFT_203143 [Hypoxylon rubiginosum]
MSSPEKDHDTQASESGEVASNPDASASYSLDEYICAEPTESERVSGAVDDASIGDGNEKRCEDKAMDALNKFDDDWGSASN